MDYLRINFEEMRFGAMKETFESLERAFRKFDVDFYLIGAFARDMWMNHLEDLPIRRTTNDVDFSVYVHNYQDFANLKQYLVDIEEFTRDDEPYRLFSKSGTMIDLIPFGGIEQNNQVYLDGTPPMALSVFGNQEVFNHAQSLEIEGNSFKICTLPGLCILKLISGHEKADRVEKDMGDFYYILENYFEIAGDTIYEDEFEDLIDEEFDPLISSIKMLGRQMKPILTDSGILGEKIMNILDKLKEKFNDREIEQMYIADPKDRKIQRFKLVSTLSRELKK